MCQTLDLLGKCTLGAVTLIFVAKIMVKVANIVSTVTQILHYITFCRVKECFLPSFVGILSVPFSSFNLLRHCVTFLAMKVLYIVVIFRAQKRLAKPWATCSNWGKVDHGKTHWKVLQVRIQCCQLLLILKLLVGNTANFNFM